MISLERDSVQSYSVFCTVPSCRSGLTTRADALGVSSERLNHDPVVRVPEWAMSTPCRLCRKRRTPKNVLTHRDGFEVCRIHATPVPAEMIEGEAGGNRPDENFVGNPMGKRVDGV
jgi:hypothetical protein